MNTRYIFACALTFMAVGCTILLSDESQIVQRKEITISAYRADEKQAETKTQRDESDGSVWWTPGDAISLFYGSGTAGGNRFVSNSTQASKITNFTGTIGVITGGADVSVEDTFFWGLYPYNETASCDGSSVTTTLPSEQVATPSTFAPNLFPSLGRSQGLTMGFYNICGGVRFTVTKEGLKKVTLRAIGGESLTGRARIGFDGGIPKVLEITDGSDEITLTAPDGKYLEVGKYYYFITFPQALSEGIEMKFESFTEEGTFERHTSSLTIKRSIFGTLNNVDQNVVYEQKTGNIPIENANFKAYLVENFDANGDGEISFQEADFITTIYTGTNEITSVQGIEFMKNLHCLYLSGYVYPGGQLQFIDVSNNTALAVLECYGNSLTSLDVTKNTALISLNCSDNPLTSLDVSNNTALTLLWCCRNSLTSLDVTKNTALTNLFCVSNSLTSLDVTKNTALRTLDCSRNSLASLDVSKNTALERLLCNYNSLTSLDVTKNTALNTLNCSDNSLTDLDVSYNTVMTNLLCYYNSLTDLDVTKNTALIFLNCSDNSLTDLDVSYNTVLTDLYCGDNSLTSLDVSNNTALIYLNCSDNSLTSLDVSNNTALTNLDCAGNSLTSLVVSNNTALTDLYCGDNSLTSLDVSNNTALTNLWCAMESLLTLRIAQGQEIDHVTVNRSENHISVGTEIVVVPSNGSGEGTGNENW